MEWKQNHKNLLTEPQVYEAKPQKGHGPSVTVHHLTSVSFSTWGMGIGKTRVTFFIR